MAPSQNTSMAGPCLIMETDVHVVQGWLTPEDLELNIIRAAAMDPIFSKIVAFFKENNYVHEVWAKPNNHKAFRLQITQISAPRDWLREFTRSDFMESLEKVAMAELTMVPGTLKTTPRKLPLKDSDGYLGLDSPASTSSSSGAPPKLL